MPQELSLQEYLSGVLHATAGENPLRAYFRQKTGSDMKLAAPRPEDFRLRLPSDVSRDSVQSHIERFYTEREYEIRPIGEGSYELKGNGQRLMLAVSFYPETVMITVHDFTRLQ